MSAVKLWRLSNQQISEYPFDNQNCFKVELRTLSQWYLILQLISLLKLSVFITVQKVIS